MQQIHLPVAQLAKGKEQLFDSIDQLFPADAENDNPIARTPMRTLMTISL